MIALLGKRERLRQGIPRAGKVRFSMEVKPPQVLVPASGCTVLNRICGTSHSKSRTQGWMAASRKAMILMLLSCGDARVRPRPSLGAGLGRCPISVNLSGETLIDEQQSGGD